MRCDRTTWRGRKACLIGNELVELTHLTGGGHIVDFHFRDKTRDINPFWVPRWKTLEPFSFKPEKHARIYGPPETGKLLCGIAGHNLCLDLFGMPSLEEIRCGGTIHGEAGVSLWRVSRKSGVNQAKLQFSVRLPRAELAFTRSLLLRSGESVVYVRETVKNERRVDQFVQWQQHATLGAPFLSEDCVIDLPGARGRTIPAGYEGRELLKNDAEFRWPHAPRFDRGRVDLRRPLAVRARGFIAGIQIAPNRTYGFVCALNRKLSLVIGYCFRRADFPWVALWEENRARRNSPWRGREKTRGLEFGTSPLPLTRAENFMQGQMFGAPTLAHIPARSTRKVSYVLFLAHVPQGTRSIADVVVGPDSLKLIDSSDKVISSLPAGALREYTTDADE
jgi:hypothetical protein